MKGLITPFCRAYVAGRTRAPQQVLWAAGVLLVLLGGHLRLQGLTASLSLDEFGTFWVVESGSTTTLTRALQFQGQSPSFYLLPWISIRAAGESEAALRMPPIVIACLLCVVLYASGRLLCGPKGAAFAAVLGWLNPTAVRSSVEARPYSLSLLAVAGAVGAFLWAGRTGSLRAKVVWIVAGAAVAWAHYVQFPLVAGLVIACAAIPELRAVYKVGRFVRDGLWHVALVGLCVPHLAALFVRRQALSWIDEPDRLVFVLVLLPLPPAIVLGSAAGFSRQDPAVRIARQALWIGLFTHVVVLELASAFGMNLTAPRYSLVMLVPGVLPAATALARIRPVDVAIGFLGFAIIGGGALIARKSATGTYSGIGFNDWWGAVEELSKRLQPVAEAIVFYRSGFAEEDLAPLSRLPAATLAPLRSPRCAPVAWPATSLTFRRGNPQREAYFDSVVVPRIGGSPEFFVLTAKGTPEKTPYPDVLVAWVQEKWPERFQVTCTNFGSVEILEFRSPGP